jgi:tRNA modification GTPase
MQEKFPSQEDTIAALATATGEGGVAVVRISGRLALGILSSVFRRKGGGPVVPRRLYYGEILDPETGSVIDSGLSVYMPAPNSYTGEDVVEIHCHGGFLLPKKVLSACLSCGARLASPGEFTLRAFLNGKLDLAQAEAVCDLVNAETDEALRVARGQLQGELSRRICELKEEALDILAEVEAQIDFPEEGIEGYSGLCGRVEGLTRAIETLARTFDEGRLLKEGVRVAIIGKPNVGKSSLLNRLLMRERAIVSPQPGTTRDFIEEGLRVGGIPLRLVDTAGLRATADEVERAGVELAKRKVEEAQLVLLVLDGSRALDGDDMEAIRYISDKKAILIVNKSDLRQVASMEEISNLARGAPIVATSAATGAGIDELRVILERTIVGEGRRTDGGGVVITELRHKEALDKAREGLTRMLSALGRGESPEFLALELRVALDALSEVTGEITTEDVLGRIFSRFCIGK